MEDKEKSSRGISLRRKKEQRPKISAPKQISGPLPANLQAPDIPDEYRSRNTSASSVTTRSAGGTRLDAPRERPQPAGGKTSDLVKRRYSTRFNQLPNDYTAGAPPVPGLPSKPNQYMRPPVPEPKPSQEARRIPVDVKAFKDPKLKADECKYNRAWNSRARC